MSKLKKVLKSDFIMKSESILKFLGTFIIIDFGLLLLIVWIVYSIL